MWMSALFLSVAMQAEEQLPLDVYKDIEYAGEMCRAMGKRFAFDMFFVDKLDFNGDGATDYIVDGRGYDCGKVSERIYGNKGGMPVQIYISYQKDGKARWDKVYNAYAYEYRVKRKYGELPYFDAWLHAGVGYRVNFVRYQWVPEADEFQVIDQETGVEVPKQLWKNFD